MNTQSFAGHPEYRPAGFKAAAAGAALALALLAGCSSSPRAPADIVERGRAGAKPPASVATAPLGTANAAAGTTYVVKAGDTLYRIAMQFGRSYREIVEWNNLPSANEIRVGQVLSIAPPGSAGSTPAAGGAVLGQIEAGRVEVKPIGLPGAAPAAPTVISGSGQNAATKNAPLGEKRPYSDANYADMQKGPVVSGPAIASPTAAPAAAVASGTPVAQVNTPPSVQGWIWPTNGAIGSNFAQNKKGIDIRGDSGQPVLAANAGKVVYAGTGIHGFGNLIIVKHSPELLSAYAHNRVILVKEGQNVTRGQKIAEMGNTDADRVMLHFEIRANGKPVDPMAYLPSR